MRIQDVGSRADMLTDAMAERTLLAGDDALEEDINTGIALLDEARQILLSREVTKLLAPEEKRKRAPSPRARREPTPILTTTLEPEVAVAPAPPAPPSEEEVATEAVGQPTPVQPPTASDQPIKKGVPAEAELWGLPTTHETRTKVIALLKTALEETPPESFETALDLIFADRDRRRDETARKSLRQLAGRYEVLSKGLPVPEKAHITKTFQSVYDNLGLPGNWERLERVLTEWGVLREQAVPPIVTVGDDSKIVTLPDVPKIETID